MSWLYGLEVTEWSMCSSFLHSAMQRLNNEFTVWIVVSTRELGGALRRFLIVSVMRRRSLPSDKM